MVYNGRDGGTQMAGVYYQVRAESVSDAVQCGLKLSEHADREIMLPGENHIRRVMSAWLHPHDLPEKTPKDEYRCLRLEMDPARCHVGDADLYRLGLLHPALMQRYLDSIVLLRDYRFGVFRRPECLISFSLLDTQIAVIGSVMDTPVLYGSSSSLYLQNRMSAYDEALQDDGNALLFAWCRLLETKGMVERFQDAEGLTEIYVSKRTGNSLVLSVPERTDAEVWP